jgi:hypothetical protein
MIILSINVFFSERVMLLSGKWAMFQLYHGWHKYHVNDDDVRFDQHT